MNKDFWSWHSKKEFLNSLETRPFFHEREVWYCHMGVNVGSEQDGKGLTFVRPVIIIKKFNNEIFWAIPLTSAIKKTEYYFIACFDGHRASSAILSQIRLIDAKRLSHKIHTLPHGDFLYLKKKLKALLP
jgi:mRNA interferase MazF